MMPTLMRAYGSLLSQPGTQPEPQAQANTNNRQNGFSLQHGHIKPLAKAIHLLCRN